MSITQRFKGGNWLSLVRDLMILQFDTDKDFELVIREYKERRSLKANNYSWALTDKLSKEEMHAEMIYRYGQPELDGDQAVIISARDGVDLTEYYPYAREIGQGEVHGKLFSHWRIYRGSHTYNKAEMSLFIKGIVEECRELGIETETPGEIARMISLMKEA